MSGGSFTALAYGLYGDALLCRCDDLIKSLDNQPSDCVVTDTARKKLFKPSYVESLKLECASDPTLTLFEWQFLKRNVQSTLIRKVANPLNWPKLALTDVGRSELAEEYYDDILFQKTTYADLREAANPPDKPRPQILVSATDLASGARIVFTQETFESFCSDLTSIRLARAVAASSAYPVFLSPVTLKNFGSSKSSSCKFKVRDYLESAYGMPVKNFSVRAKSRVREMERIEVNTKENINENTKEYLHLVDGGVSDNLGVRSALEGIEMQKLQGRSLNNGVKRIAVIVVNASAEGNSKWASNRSPPGICLQLKQELSVPIDRYAIEQIDLLKELLNDKGQGPSGYGSTQYYPIVVSFNGIEDDKEDAEAARYFNNLPTNFHLEDDLVRNPPPRSLDGKDAVDRVVKRGRKLLRDDCEFQRLVHDMGGNPCKSPCRCR